MEERTCISSKSKNGSSHWEDASSVRILFKYCKNERVYENSFPRMRHSVDKYVLDFYCSSEKLAIELDGEYHFTDGGLVYDEKRTNYLNSLNIRVLRFENEEIIQSPDGVLGEIGRHFTRQ